MLWGVPAPQLDRQPAAAAAGGAHMQLAVGRVSSQLQ